MNGERLKPYFSSWPARRNVGFPHFPITDSVSQVTGDGLADFPMLSLGFTGGRLNSTSSDDYRPLASHRP